MSDDELKNWSMLTFIGRCAQPYSTIFAAVETEPELVPIAVTDAVAVAELRILSGGNADEGYDSGVCISGATYSDQWHMEALLTALPGFR